MTIPIEGSPARALMTQERRDQIVDLVQRDGHARVVDLAHRFDVSEVTIRSDLVVLEHEGRLVRDRGGARARDRESFVSSLLRVDQRASMHLEEKRRIGRAAAERIVPGDTVILDAGTTVVEIARQLGSLAPLTVVTNAINVALEIGASRERHLILLGGVFNPESGSTLGALAVQNLAELSVQKLFLGAQALDTEEGLSDSTMEIAQVKRAMIRAARQVILVTDSSKWGHASLTKVAPLADMDTIITDRGLPAEAREAIDNLGVELVLV